METLALHSSGLESSGSRGHLVSDPNSVTYKLCVPQHNTDVTHTYLRRMVMRTKPAHTCTVLKTVPDFEILLNNTYCGGGGHRNLRTATK